MVKKQIYYTPDTYYKLNKLKNNKLKSLIYNKNIYNQYNDESVNDESVNDESVNDESVNEEPVNEEPFNNEEYPVVCVKALNLKMDESKYINQGISIKVENENEKINYDNDNVTYNNVIWICKKYKHYCLIIKHKEEKSFRVKFSLNETNNETDNETDTDIDIKLQIFDIEDFASFKNDNKNTSNNQVENMYLNDGELTNIELYVVPKERYILNELLSNNDNLGINWSIFRWAGYLVESITYFIYKLIDQLKIFKTYKGSMTIIATIIIIKILFFPLSYKSYKSMARMRKIQPEMNKLRTIYSNKANNKLLQKALMELYKKNKVNPLSGCLPVLAQVPFFISFFYTLRENGGLFYNEIFFWIPNLMQKDPLFILPLLIGAIMYIQQKLISPPTDPFQAKIFKVFPFVVTPSFLFFPSGIVLSWVTNIIFSILQQWWMNNQYIN